MHNSCRYASATQVSAHSPCCTMPHIFLWHAIIVRHFPLGPHGSVFYCIYSISLPAITPLMLIRSVQDKKEKKINFIFFFFKNNSNTYSITSDYYKVLILDTPSKNTKQTSHRKLHHISTITHLLISHLCIRCYSIKVNV